MKDTMFVYKRDNRRVEVSFDKITARIKAQAAGLNVNTIQIAQIVIGGLSDGMKTSEIDEYTANICHSKTIVEHPDYSILAARILISNLHKETVKDFVHTMAYLCKYNRINRNVFYIAMEFKDQIDKCINHDRDYEAYDYFAFKTLLGSYLTKINDKVIERPQHMLMRVSIGIHGHDIDRVLETYKLMSEGYMTHATPTLYNSGTERQQNSSCFLIEIKDDTDSITLGVNKCAHMSRYAGGIGLHMGNIRSSGAPIRRTQGKSSGPIPFIKLFNQTAISFNQSGRRPGSFAIYLHVWHLNIFEFINLRLNDGNDRERARDIFPAINLNDVFMERVEEDGNWMLFCPSEVDLYYTYGDEFRKEYLKYESNPVNAEGTPLRTRIVKARDIWYAIFKSQIETGMPYLLSLDEANERNNQSNLGVLKGSNLCIEILIYTEGTSDSDPGEIGTCNLASISIPKFVRAESTVEAEGETEVEGVQKPFIERISSRFAWSEFENTIRVLTRNLNKVIDNNFYPVEDAKNSNLRHRPIAIGVQGLSSAFMALRIPYTSPEAIELNHLIFETMYYAFIDESCKLAEIEGPYESYPGSPLSQGLFQFDLWNARATRWNERYASHPQFEARYKRNMAKLSNRYDWDALRLRVREFGVRNSLGIALMPTATTSAILGNTECFECITNNCYVKKTQHGEFRIANKYLIEDLTAMGLWNNRVKTQMFKDEGSISNISEIPDNIKEIYKTIFEQKQIDLIKMSVDRAPFICHTESNNIFISATKDELYNKLHSIYMTRWRQGCKTIVYYLHQRIPNAIKFNIDAAELNKKEARASPEFVCIKDSECEACG